MGTRQQIAENPLEGVYLRVPVRGTRKGEITKAQRALLRKNYDDGQDVPKEVIYGCRVALAVKAAIGYGIVHPETGETFIPNPCVSPALGKSRSNGQVFLTFGLVRASDGNKFTFQWLGDAVPREAKKVAYLHDRGDDAKAMTIELDFSTVTKVWVTNTRPSRGPGRHDVSPATGRPYVRETNPRRDVIVLPTPSGQVKVEDQAPRSKRHDVSPRTGKPYPRPEGRLNGKRPETQRFDRIARCDF